MYLNGFFNGRNKILNFRNFGTATVFIPKVLLSANAHLIFITAGPYGIFIAGEKLET